MSWTTPKTDWVDGDYFNVTPDYVRIKGNIEYLVQMYRRFHAASNIIRLQDVSVNGYPLADFFNNIVADTQAMLNGCSWIDAHSMRTYESNGRIWNANELNGIEENHLLLYNALLKQEQYVKRLAVTIGGVRIG